MTQRFEGRVVLAPSGVSAIGIATVRRFVSAFRRLQKALGVE